MRTPEIIFILREYDKVSAHTKTINENEFSGFTLIQIPYDISKCCVLFDMQELLPEKKVVDFVPHTKREGYRPWIEIRTPILNMSPEYHLYQLSFVNPNTDAVYKLYFSYNLQQDFPDKPYVYKKTERPISVVEANW